MIEKLPEKVLRAHKGKSFVGVTTTVAIFRSDGRLFLAQRSNKARDEHGKWDICGGGLKWGATVDENIRREMAEEFDINTSATLHFAGIRQAFRTDESGDATHWISLDYIIILSDDEAAKVRINEPEIFTNSDWFDLEHLPNSLHSQIRREFLQNIKEAYIKARK